MAIDVAVNWDKEVLAKFLCAVTGTSGKKPETKTSWSPWVVIHAGFLRVFLLFTFVDDCRSRRRPRGCCYCCCCSSSLVQNGWKPQLLTLTTQWTRPRQSRKWRGLCRQGGQPSTATSEPGRGEGVEKVVQWGARAPKNWVQKTLEILGGGFKFQFFKYFHLSLGGRFPIWLIFFSDGLKPPTRVFWNDCFILKEN